MAQAEDTELRDLVIEALEKNGSLAKIRALLRANIFLAFEDECTNIKQNVSLDNILKLPEGIISLSIVHEFLEFCNLKNTLFVYMSESRQGKEYSYTGQEALAEKLNYGERDINKEPILVTLVKNALKSCQRKYFEQSDNRNGQERHSDNNYKEDQNCTYIVHEESSSTASTSHSDNSSDEKNKLHLRLHLDNSDTDTSSDSTRDKTSSEYIPNEHIINSENVNKHDLISQPYAEGQTKNYLSIYNDPEQNIQTPVYLNELKITNINSSDSTSYVELKSFNPLHQKMLNTMVQQPYKDVGEETKTSPVATQSPSVFISVHNQHQSINRHSDIPHGDSVSSDTLSSVSSLNSKKNGNETKKIKTSVTSSSQEEREKSNAQTAEYSYDFTSSPVSGKKDVTNEQMHSPDSFKENFTMETSNKHSLVESPHQNSQSSQSSVSISDVADLIEHSEIHSPFNLETSDNVNLSENNKSKVSSKKVSNKSQNKLLNEDYSDFTESSVPSLSNLSLDIHSD